MILTTSPPSSPYISFRSLSALASASDLVLFWLVPNSDDVEHRPDSVERVEEEDKEQYS